MRNFQDVEILLCCKRCLAKLSRKILVANLRRRVLATWLCRKALVAKLRSSVLVAKLSRKVLVAKLRRRVLVANLICNLICKTGIIRAIVEIWLKMNNASALKRTIDALSRQAQTDSKIFNEHTTVLDRDC